MKIQSIKIQLLVAFILLALMPISLVSYFIYNSFYHAQIVNVIDNLSKLADKKVEQINGYTKEHLNDVLIFSKSPAIRNDINNALIVFYQHGLQSKDYQQLNKNIRPFYENMLEIGGYYDAFFISPQGDIVFTIKQETDLGTNLLKGAYKNTELARIFKEASTLLSSDFSDYRYYLPSKAAAAFVAAPIFQENKLIGVIALQLDSEVFQKTLQDNMSLGNSGETVVAQQIDDHKGQFLFSLKQNRLQNNFIDLNASFGLPMLYALKGENNAGESIDYREKSVIAAWRYIPSIRMGMVVKVDREEALIVFNKIKQLQFLFLTSLFFCIGLTTLYLHRFVLAPISELTRITHQIALGDMSERLKIKVSNELGRLACAFNEMTDHLQLARETLEQKVEERTLMLKRVNNLLTEQILQREKISQQLNCTTAFQNAILNSNNVSIISTTLDGTILSFNAAAEKMLGYSACELISKQSPAIFHDADEIIKRSQQLTQQLNRKIEPGFEVFVAKTDQGADENEWTYVRKDGSRFPVWLSVTHILNEEKEKIGYLGVASDMTERKNMENELLLSYNAIEHTSEGILITDNKGFITNVNPAYSRIMGYERNEVIGKNPSYAKSGRHQAVFYQTMWKKIFAEGFWEGEIWDRRKDGSVFPKWLSISAIKNPQGTVINYVGIFKDISQQKATEEKLRQLAFYDPLTQLPNRALFRDRLTQELINSKRYQTQTAVFFIDLDRFKWVNDNLGHDIGDDLLVAVASRITRQVRESDSVCRLGGDEFTVVLGDLADINRLKMVAENIITELKTVFMIKGYEVFIGASIGIAVFPQDGEDFETLIKHADIAMYEAKNAGRGTYRFYQSSPAH